MKQIKLPEKCPICGAGFYFGNIKTVEHEIVGGEEMPKFYSAPIVHYHCGAKMWLDRKRLNQYTIILNECEVENEWNESLDSN